LKEAANFSAETFITRATVNIVDIVEVLFAKRMFSAKKVETTFTFADQS